MKRWSDGDEEEDDDDNNNADDDAYDYDDANLFAVAGMHVHLWVG